MTVVLASSGTGRTADAEIEVAQRETMRLQGLRVAIIIAEGYHEHEYRAFGFPYDHRLARFAEGIHIIRGLLRDGEIDYAGRFFSARETSFVKSFITL